ncbi:hypothetical protein [Cellulomonas humilata]|uniref:N-acetyltransferase domain-containing protein n=1 Tax=Cellulomonas humilata TaxID=144055 RepID=A0ABU0E9P6_9CELL|nr:hypothetical protein [Cellulomonas humilata]MDQ0371974.1 hypothetical protein [Cellulomonas humilata]
MTTPVRLSPVDDGNLPEIARFLHENLNSRLSADAWARALAPTWRTAEPTHGFGLWADGVLVGVYAAFFSERVVAGRERRICNLAAWCVLDGYGAHGLRLLRALLSCGADVFTDLSPSGSVVPIDLRLGFQRLDTTTDVRPGYPSWQRRVTVVTDQRRIADLLTGRDAELFRDHVGSAAVQHVVLLVDGRPCYVMYRRVRRKRLPVFGALVHVGDTALFARGVRSLGAHLLVRGMPVLLAERRIVGGPVAWSRTVQGRPKLFKGADVEAADIDDLYSEITSVPW